MLLNSAICSGETSNFFLGAQDRTDKRAKIEAVLCHLFFTSISLNEIEYIYYKFTFDGSKLFIFMSRRYAKETSLMAGFIIIFKKKKHLVKDNNEEQNIISSG